MKGASDIELHLVEADTERHRAGRFVEAQSAALGRPALSEQFQAALVHGEAERAATLMASRPPGQAPLGLAQLRRDRDWELETVVDQSARAGPGALERALIEAAVDQVAGRGGGTLHYWVHGLAPSAGPRPAPAGFELGRELLELRVDLPLEPAVTERSPALSTRAFRTGRDEEAWLRANNRAFAEHPEQGHWDLATLLEREQRDWFDPEGFLLCEIDGRLAGSCWTKVHGQANPPMGEIYVISVDPDFAGRGLGRALTVAGLAHLGRNGLRVGMLYVDRANEPALGLYRSLGFQTERIERAYVRTVRPAAG